MLMNVLRGAKQLKPSTGQLTKNFRVWKKDFPAEVSGLVNKRVVFNCVGTHAKKYDLVYLSPCVHVIRKVKALRTTC